MRRNEQRAVAALKIAERHVAEEGRGVRADILVCRNERDIRILLCGLLVIIACADLRDMAQCAALPQSDEADLGMNLVVLKAIEHLAARFLQPLGPVDVVLLVKAGAAAR